MCRESCKYKYRVISPDAGFFLVVGGRRSSQCLVCCRCREMLCSVCGSGGEAKGLVFVKEKSNVSPREARVNVTVSCHHLQRAFVSGILPLTMAR